jgi:phenylpyruvate tautomerase PptA (4-oxalocrotonate tautomerase family)
VDSVDIIEAQFRGDVHIIICSVADLNWGMGEEEESRARQEREGQLLLIIVAPRTQ